MKQSLSNDLMTISETKKPIKPSSAIANADRRLTAVTKTKTSIQTKPSPMKQFSDLTAKRNN